MSASICLLKSSYYNKLCWVFVLTFVKCQLRVIEFMQLEIKFRQTKTKFNYVFANSVLLNACRINVSGMNLNKKTHFYTISIFRICILGCCPTLCGCAWECLVVPGNIWNIIWALLSYLLARNSMWAVSWGSLRHMQSRNINQPALLHSLFSLFLSPQLFKEVEGTNWFAPDCLSVLPSVRPYVGNTSFTQEPLLLGIVHWWVDNKK